MSDNDSEIAWTITALRILLDIHPASEDGALVKGAEDLTAERDRLKADLAAMTKRAVTAEEETWDLHECDEGKACHICRNVYARREGAEG